MKGNRTSWSIPWSFAVCSLFFVHNRKLKFLNLDVVGSRMTSVFVSGLYLFGRSGLARNLSSCLVVSRINRTNAHHAAVSGKSSSRYIGCTSRYSSHINMQHLHGGSQVKKHGMTSRRFQKSIQSSCHLNPEYRTSHCHYTAKMSRNFSDCSFLAFSKRLSPNGPLSCTHTEQACVASCRFLLCFNAAQQIGVMLTP